MNDHKDCGPNDSYSDGGLPNHPQPADDVRVYGGIRGGGGKSGACVVFRSGIAPEPGRYVTLPVRIAELYVQHGSVQAAAGAVGIHPGYLLKLMSGERTAVTEGMLRRMGLGEASVTYERLPPEAEKSPEITPER